MSWAEGGPVAAADERVTVLVDAVQRLSLARSVAEVQAIVRTAARALAGSDGATFVLRDDGQCLYADEDAISPLWKGQRFPLSACISGWAMLHAEHVVIPDIYADDRIPHDAYRPTFVRSLVMVPIRRLDPIGAIGNYWASHHAPSDEEIALLQALADSTAVALENVAVWEELERRVVERTADLSEALVRNERLLHTLAHEVRNPLGATQGLLELVAEEPGLSPDAVTDLAHASEAVEEGLRIVNEQLDLARLRAGEMRVRLQEVHPEELLATLEGMARGLRHAVGVSVVVEADAHLTDITTDPHLVGQALRNLVSNALKFTDAGEVRVAARVDGAMVRFEVSDTGIGIPVAEQEAVFEEFGRVEAHEHRPGTGLGLPLVRRIAEALGGRVDLVRSVPGQGSTFALSLPR